MLPTFEQHLKFIRNQDVYDELMDIKNNDDAYNRLTSKEFMCVIYINDCFNNKMKLPQISKLIPKEYFWILKEQFKNRFTKLTVCWNKIIHCPLSGHDPEYYDYLWSMMPHRNIPVSVQDF